MDKIIAFSGSHGTGKSYAAYNETINLKRQYPNKSVVAICDLDAFCPYPINKNSTEKTQMWMFSNRIQKELEAMRHFDIVVTDRTIVDVLAYTHIAGLHDLSQQMLSFAKHHMQYYKKIIFKQIKYNQYWHADGIRETSDEQFRQDIEDVMLKFYKAIRRSKTLLQFI